MTLNIDERVSNSDPNERYTYIYGLTTKTWFNENGSWAGMKKWPMLVMSRNAFPPVNNCPTTQDMFKVLLDGLIH